MSWLILTDSFPLTSVSCAFLIWVSTVRKAPAYLSEGPSTIAFGSQTYRWSCVGK